MPIQSMLHRVGFTRPRGLPRCGELLPRLFTLTGRSRRLFSVALSLRSPSAAVSSYPCSLMLGLSSFALTAPAAAWLTRKPYYIIFFASCQHFIQMQRTSNLNLPRLLGKSGRPPARVSPRKNCPPDSFFSPSCASLRIIRSTPVRRPPGRFRALRSATRGTAPRPRGLLKKAGENFLILRRCRSISRQALIYP